MSTVAFALDKDHVVYRDGAAAYRVVMPGVLPSVWSDLSLATKSLRATVAYLSWLAGREDTWELRKEWVAIADSKGGAL